MGKRYMHYRGTKAIGGWAEPGWAACLAYVHPSATTKERGAVTCPKCKEHRSWRIGPRPFKRTKGMVP